MAKSPNGKIVKSLYLKIAYVWTRPYRVLTTLLCQIFSSKARSDGLCKTHWKVALNFACAKYSELETSLSTAFYAGLNVPLVKLLIEIFLVLVLLEHFEAVGGT